MGKLVEETLLYLKTTLLEVRPIYHHTDIRIKTHVFIFILAYYVLWYAKQKLQPLIHNEKNNGAKRKCTMQRIINELKSICKNTLLIEIENQQTIYSNITEPNEHQKMILKLLGIKL